MSWWYRLRTWLIQKLAGKDIAVMANVVLSGNVYPYGRKAKWMFVTCNFIMGNTKFNADPDAAEEVDDKINVDSNA